MTLTYNPSLVKVKKGRRSNGSAVRALRQMDSCGSITSTADEGGNNAPCAPDFRFVIEVYFKDVPILDFCRYADCRYLAFADMPILPIFPCGI